MNTSLQLLPRAKVNAPLQMLLTIISFGLIISSCSAISCYACNSDKNSHCTPARPSGEAIPAGNCTNPNDLFKQWITSVDFIKAGIDALKLDKVIDFFTDKTKEAAELKSITTCAYLYASTENKVTVEFDKAAAKVRAAFGDENANDPITIKRWVMRDCVTLELQEGAKDTLNRCVPVEGTKDIATLRFCTCTTDKCNYPNAELQGIIKKAEADSSGGIRPEMMKLLLLLVTWAVVYGRLL